MRVLIDPQIFNHQVRGGISRYVFELVKGLHQFGNITVIFPVMFSRNKYLLEFRMYLKLLNIFSGMLSIKAPLWNRVIVNIVLRFCKVDIFIPSFYETYYFKHLGNKKLVITIHDMIHEKFPHFIENSEKVIINKKKLIERADAIIAVSQNTKNDILQCYPYIDPAKIKVIYSGNSIAKIAQKSKLIQPLIDGDYYVYVGLRKSYKNFIWMLHALYPMLVNHDIRLICIGGGVFNRDEEEVIGEMCVGGKIIQMDSSDVELINIYQHATALIMPSIYEGFGFPIIEAMSVGCPVILNKNSCFPEIAGDAGCYYEADDIEQFQHMVNIILKDNEFRNQQINKGLKNAEKFSWERCIEDTAYLLSEL